MKAVEAKLPVLLAASALALAGCLGTSAPAPANDPAPLAALASASAGSTIVTRDCTEGGGHSNYNKPDWEAIGVLPEPWDAADVSADIGPQTMTSIFPLGSPTMWMAEGPQVGIYHTAVSCASATVDGADVGPIGYGYVGVKVNPPPFDTGGAKTHYLIVVFAVSDDRAVRSLEGRGFHPSKAQSAVVEWLGPVFHSVLDDAHHGVYESHLRMREAGDMDPGPVRLWMIVEDGEGKYRPISVDFANEGGIHLQGEGRGAFTHLRTEDHAPLPGAGGDIPGLGYRDFTRTITVGPAPAVQLDEAWLH